MTRVMKDLIFGYDQDGNRITQTNRLITPNQTSYSYDQANRLTGYNGQSGVAQYAYSGDGSRPAHQAQETGSGVPSAC